MAGLKWYIDRWKAMDKAERKERLRQQLRRWKDWWTVPDFRLNAVSLEPKPDSFPHLPPSEQAPDELKNALRFDSDRILSGSWTVFMGRSLAESDRCGNARRQATGDPLTKTGIGREERTVTRGGSEREERAAHSRSTCSGSNV